MGGAHPIAEYAKAPDKGHDSGTVLEQRSVRALSECMTVLAKGGDVYSVTTQSGSEYAVDSREGRCTCADYQYRDDVERCKHVRRVDYATGEMVIPAGVDVDPLIGEHIEGTPRQAVTDGGEVIIAGDDGEVLTDESDDGDDNCACSELPSGYPCWDCFKDGATFEGRN